MTFRPCGNLEVHSSHPIPDANDGRGAGWCVGVTEALLEHLADLADAGWR